jgi:hypothetical protein
MILFFTTHEIFAAFLRDRSSVREGGRRHPRAGWGDGPDGRDYLQREELAVSRPRSGRGGAIQQIMERKRPITSVTRRCLVIGFGRIGKVHPCHRLRGLCAQRHGKRTQLFRSGLDTCLRL